MKPRKLYELILIILLLIIASPFIIGFVLIFVVLYIIIFPFEGIIYFKSNYYKDLNEKYYLFITRSNSFKRYRKIKKQEPNRLIFLEFKFELKGENDMINFNKYYIDNPKGTIIIVHGIAEHSGRYLSLAKRFNNEGFNVLTYDHIGHGKSSGKRGKLKSFKDNINVLHEMVVGVKQEFPDGKVFLLGHSMGGGVVNLYAATYQDVDGIVSVAAATGTPRSANMLKYTGFWYLRWVRVNTKIFDNDLAKDPKVLELNKQDPLMLKYMYVSLIGEMFVKGIKYLNNNIENITAPIIYIHGTGDNIVNYHCSINMYNKIPSKDKELKLYDGEYHEILNDYNKEVVIKDIINWLNKRS